MRQCHLNKQETRQIRMRFKRLNFALSGTGHIHVKLIETPTNVFLPNLNTANRVYLALLVIL